MKHIYSNRLVILFVIILLIELFFHQNTYSMNINLFSRIENPKSIQSKDKFLMKDEVLYFQINKISLKQILNEKPDILQFDLHLSNNTVWHLELQRYEVFASTAVVSAGTEDGDKPIDFRQNIANYRGKVTNQNDLPVNITFSPNDVNAIFFSENQTWVLGSYDNSNPGTFILSNQDNISDKPTFTCSTDERKISEKVLDIMYNLNNGSSSKNNSLLNDKPLTVEVAVEMDYQTFEFFKQDTVKALAYITGLYSVSSQIYERDVNTKLSLSFVHIWTTEDDPYTDDPLVSGDVILKELIKYWENNYKSVKRDVVNYITKQRTVDYLGLVNSIGGICDDRLSYTYCNIVGTYNNFPSYSLDVYLVCHENGHIFGSVHTHNCMWPGGPLDSCELSNGEAGYCITEKVPSTGTIMSYCSNLNLVFHPKCKAVIRSYLERSSCTGSQVDAEKIYKLSGKLFYKGKTISGVKLTLKPGNNDRFKGSIAPGDNAESVTDSEGNYSFNNLASGYYKIETPDGFVFLPINWFSSNNVIVPGQDTHKDLYVERLPKVPVKISNINTSDTVKLIIIKKDSSEFSTINVVVYDSLKNIYQFNGEYTIIPSANNIMFTPKSVFVSVLDEDLPEIQFHANYTSNMMTVFGTVKFNDDNNNFIPMENTPISRRDENYNILETRMTDENGIFIFDSVKYFYDYDFKSIDTSQYTPIQWYVKNFDKNLTYIYLGLRNRILPTITNNYLFDSRIENYTEITGNILGSGNSIQNSYSVSLPFSFKYGTKNYKTIFVNRGGFISLGVPFDYGFYPLNPTTVFLFNPLSSLQKADGFISAMGSYYYGIDTSDKDLKSYITTNSSGNSPNRVFTIEYKNLFQLYNPVQLPVNFQIKLYETTGNIEFVYGKMSKSGNFSITGQVGLRGSDLYDFNNRSVTSDWSNSTKGKSYNDAAECRQNSYPFHGLTYRWTNTMTSVNDHQPVSFNNSLEIYPNVASYEFEINYNITANSSISIEIFDLLGNKLYTLTQGYLPSGTYTAKFDAKLLNSGIYNCVLRSEDGVVSKKFIVL